MPNTKLMLSLDAADSQIIFEAVAERQRICPLPGGKSDEIGETIAEICRGWLERVDRKPS